MDAGARGRSPLHFSCVMTFLISMTGVSSNDRHLRAARAVADDNIRSPLLQHRDYQRADDLPPTLMRPSQRTSI